MTRPVRIPTPRSEVADLKERVLDLERRLRARQDQLRPADVAAGAGVMIFHQPGTVALSPSVVARWHPPASSSLAVVASLGTAGSSSTVVTFYKNGSAISGGTVTLTSSDQYESATIAATFNGTTDYLTARVTTAGTTAAELVVAVAAS